MSARDLPARPDLQQLKHQAKELLRDFRVGAASAIADFDAFHPDHVTAQDAKLADAQLVLARSYHASSWPQLVVICELIDAIKSGDVGTINHISVTNADLMREKAALPNIGWHAAMTPVANDGLRRIITMLRERGAADVDSALARTELRPHIDALRFLGRLGARFPKDAIGGAVESLAASNFAFMVEMGTEIVDERGDWRSRVALTLETYARDPEGKHKILETIAAQGIPLPDTPAMALHRGRVDLLEQFLTRDSSLLWQTFTHHEIFPPELGCHADESLALVGAPLGGATLLHMAVEYEELPIVQWLLDKGMNANVNAAIDADGFGGHTPLFNCVVTYNAGRRDDRIARMLLDRGANPNVRASLRKRLAFAKDKSVHEYRNVTPVGWGLRFHDQSYVSQPNMRIIAERGGIE